MHFSYYFGFLNFVLVIESAGFPKYVNPSAIFRNPRVTLVTRDFFLVTIVTVIKLKVSDLSQWSSRNFSVSSTIIELIVHSTTTQF